MAGSVPRSSSRRAAAGRRRAGAVAGAVFALAGCTETLDPLSGTTSLRVTLVSPDDPGSADARLPDSARALSISVEALDVQGELDDGFTAEVDVYAHFLGGLTPELGRSPLTTISMAEGRSGEVSLELPPVFGRSFLWLEDGGGGAPSFATGTSPELWYRDAFLEDISRPIDEASLGALEDSPLEKKQIDVVGSRYGARGRLVITGIYAQGYTLSDVECADEAGAPPCTTRAYDSLFVFSFSRPEDEQGAPFAVGDQVGELRGSIGEFNGLTEVNFPQSFRDDEAGDLARVPAPTVIEDAWLTGKIEMERVESALVAIEDATLCPIDDDFEMYSQWKLDVGFGCPTADDDKAGEIINVITKGQVNDFVPADHVGEVLPRVVGTLRPVNTAAGGFNVWILYPRSLDDIELP